MEQDKRDIKYYQFEREKEEKEEAEYMAQQKIEEEKLLRQQREEEEKQLQKSKELKQLQGPSSSTVVPSTPEPMNENKSMSSSKKKSEEEKPNYVQKGLRAIAKLIDVRHSLAAFDKSKHKFISKRRLQMKKIVRGRLNTLNPTKDKVTSVVKDIYAAIKTAKEEDYLAKKQQGTEDIPPEATRGFKYLLDLLTSNLVTRIQGEGFSG